MKNRSNFCQALSVICIALMTVAASADLLKTAPNVNNERGSIAVTDNSGKPRWTAEWTMSPDTVGSHPAVRFTENGHGRYSPFLTEVQWSLTALWSADGSYRPLRFEKTFKDPSGRVLSVEKKTFNQENHKMTFERTGANGRPEKSQLDVPDDTLAVEGIAGILQAFPFEAARPFPTHLLSNEPKVYSITIEPRGRERLQTPLGALDCYKIEFVPHVGFLKHFIKKTQFWFTVAPPHFWVRYEGYENGYGTPQIVMDMKTYEGSH
jgi:hypothetical protein